LSASGVQRKERNMGQYNLIWGIVGILLIVVLILILTGNVSL
jgi:hypothetical protein